MSMGREMSALPNNTARFFTRSDGGYHFARWGRAVAPIVFGVEDESLAAIKSTMARVVGISGQKLAETDPELGANFMWFFCKDWDELAEVPNLGKLFADFDGLLKGLKSANASRHRTFSFDQDGGIKLCVVLIRMDKQTADMPIQTLVTGETLQSLLVWGEGAFDSFSPIAVIKDSGICIVKPEIAAMVRAAYDPALPVSTDDASHALRLSARAGMLLKELPDET